MKAYTLFWLFAFFFSVSLNAQQSIESEIKIASRSSLEEIEIDVYDVQELYNKIDKEDFLVFLRNNQIYIKRDVDSQRLKVAKNQKLRLISLNEEINIARKKLDLFFLNYPNFTVQTKIVKDE